MPQDGEIEAAPSSSILTSRDSLATPSGYRGPSRISWIRPDIVVFSRRTCSKAVMIFGRHAWEIRGDRPVYGFFIIEGPALPPEWVGYASDTISESVLRSSLPHRTIEERSMLKAGFLGVTTWQTVCDALKIDRCRLIPELVAVKP